MEKLAQIGTAAAPVRRAGEVGDGRLKALYAVQAGMNARDIQKNQKTDKAINKNNAVGINISLGSTGWKDLKDLQKNFFSMEPWAH